MAEVNLDKLLVKQQGLPEEVFLAFTLMLEGNIKDADRVVSHYLVDFLDYPEAHYIHGLILFERKLYQSSRKAINYANKHIKDKYSFYLKLAELAKQSSIKPYGLALFHAIQYYELAQLLRPDQPIPGLARAYWQTGQFNKAKWQLRNLIALSDEPDRSYYQVKLANLHFYTGNIRKGLELYKYRSNLVTKRPYKYPFWHSQPLAGKNLLVTGEFHNSDTFLHATLLSEVEKEVKHCMIEIDPSLLPLFERSFPDIEFIPQHCSTVQPIERPIDFQVPLGDLIYQYRQEKSDFNRQSPYLLNNIELTSHIEKEYNALFGSKIRVGIIWNADEQSTFSQHARRSLSLEDLTSLLLLPNIQFIDIQQHSSSNEVHKFANTHQKIIYRDSTIDPKDMDSLAAQLCALDLVISVDHTILHLAGSLGIPSWALLSYAPHWYWLDDNRKSTWYPSVRIFKQPSVDNWSSVVEIVKRKLIALTTI